MYNYTEKIFQNFKTYSKVLIYVVNAEKAVSWVSCLFQKICYMYIKLSNFILI